MTDPSRAAFFGLVLLGLLFFFVLRRDLLRLFCSLHIIIETSKNLIHQFFLLIFCIRPIDNPCSSRSDRHVVYFHRISSFDSSSSLSCSVFRVNEVMTLMRRCKLSLSNRSKTVGQMIKASLCSPLRNLDRFLIIFEQT